MHARCCSCVHAATRALRLASTNQLTPSRFTRCRRSSAKALLISSWSKFRVLRSSIESMRGFQATRHDGVSHHKRGRITPMRQPPTADRALPSHFVGPQALAPSHIAERGFHRQDRESELI
ncbi:hypothetical protein L1887_53523 [Cichorium endivia]|nr:hypothetical protein L1887_53523 [Cichorium endivia]